MLFPPRGAPRKIKNILKDIFFFARILAYNLSLADAERAREAERGVDQDNVVLTVNGLMRLIVLAKGHQFRMDGVFWLAVAWVHGLTSLWVGGASWQKQGKCDERLCGN